MGPPRTGKTVWARSLGPHVYLSGTWDYDVFMAEYRTANYVIFDDIPTDANAMWKSFFGAQRSFSITGKYKKSKRVEWGKPMIYLCNYDMNPLLTLYGNYFELNSVVVEIIDPLF